ncbi:hypothetical protein B7R25_11490 [Subtercola boreus]|uniref:Dienelactone hydrolase domain-containing protein n=2 Tax=Subtercola boreus TaxID=120213 RepID=A0A3E0WB30_9MICO|nr:hypothetical protein B7R24_11390 [Subtercola boreus]RFA25883.1 hypothetical protein B7R25_11490 [Subtercola boreus]
MMQAAGVPFPAFVAYPAGAPETYRGAVIVLHEVWGLGDEIRRVAERYAAEGFVALAPDLMGERAVPPEEAALLQGQLVHPDPEVREAAQPRLLELMAPIAAPAFATAALQKLVACLDLLDREEGVAGRLGITGYGLGGSYAFTLTIADARVRASVPYYGYANFPVELLGEIACPILSFVGEDDLALFAALPALTAQMKEAGVEFTAIAYRGAGHAFANEGNPGAYRRDAAQDSWKKSIAFFTERLT